MSLPLYMVGPDADRFDQSFLSSLYPLGAAAVKALPHRRRLYIKLRIPLKESLDTALVLLRGKGAGRIHQPASRPDHAPGPVQDLSLPSGTHGHIFLAPMASGLFVLPKHPLPGAGGVHHHLVKKTGKAQGKLPRLLICHHPVGNAHPLHVLGQDLCPGWMDLIGYQKSTAFKPSPDLGRLPPWRAAQIQNLVPWPCVQKLSHRHGAWLLDIVNPSLMPDMPSRPRVPVIIIPALCPGDLFKSKPGRKLQNRRRVQNLQWVQPQPRRPLLPIAFHKPGVLPLPQKPSHLLEKLLWKLYMLMLVPCHHICLPLMP